MFDTISRPPPQVDFHLHKLREDAAAVRSRLNYDLTSDTVAALAHTIDAVLGTDHAELAAHKTALTLKGKAHDEATIAAACYASMIDAVTQTLVLRAIDHLTAIYPHDGTIEIIALTAPGRMLPPVAGKTGDPNFLETAKRYLTSHMGHANLYHGVQPRNETFSAVRKSSEGDVAAHSRVFLDIDRRYKPAPENAEDWEQRRDSAVAKLKTFAPLAIVHSGEGVQALFAVEPTADRAEMARRKAATKPVEVAWDSDAVNNLDRVCRLPWTVNLPDARKRDRGRTLALARPVLLETQPKIWNFDALVDALTGAEHATPAKSATSCVATDVALAQLDDCGTPGQGRTRALAPDFADLCLLALPNEPGGPYDNRDQWVRTCAMHKGAGGSVEVFIEWSMRWGGSSDEAARTFESMQPDIGLRELMGELGLNAPERNDLIAKYCGTAREAFEDDLPPESEVACRVRVTRGKAPATAGERRGGNAALNWVVSTGAELWCDQHGEPHMTVVDQAGVSRNLALDDGASRHVIQGLALQAEHELTGEKLKSFLDLLRAKARASGVRRESAIRFAAVGDAVLWDTGHPDGRVFEIQPGGWTKIEMSQSPVRFTRPTGAVPLPDPQGTAASAPFVDLISQHINLAPVVGPIASAGPDDAGIMSRAALLTFVSGAMSPKGTRPHLSLEGPAGAGKTTAAGRIADLLSPSAYGVTTAPRDATHLGILARNLPIVALDNLSRLNVEMMDMLCCMSSGAGWLGRKLYSDGEMTGWALSRSCLWTSIAGGTLLRGDLALRTLPISLTRHSGNWSETRALEAWRRALPEITRALLDTMAEALATVDQIATDVEAGKAPCAPPRYRDAAELAEAFARAMGWPNWLLWQALAELNRAGQHSVINSDPLALRLLLVLKAKGGTWHAPAADWLREVLAVAGPRMGSAGSSAHARTLRGRPPCA